jgi:arylsulfatase A-like enzyme
MVHARRFRILLTVAAAVCLTVLTTVLPRAQQPTLAQEAAPPNILIFITDDQRDEDLSVMPKMLAWFESGGTHFANGFVTTSLCCPSRASIMTGRYAHNHSVFQNGAMKNFDQNSTLQKQLQAAGYTTALIGKYFQWNINDPLPYFDRFSFHSHSTVNGGYQDEFFNTDGVVEQIFEYTTTYETSTAVRFLNEFEANDEKPWLLYVNPIAPHPPSIPEAKYAATPVPPWVKNPTQPEVDRSDKPPYVQASRANLKVIEKNRPNSLRTLMSVDDMVDQVMTELDVLGETDTLAFFISDNGGLWGDHGLTGKRAPYEGSIQVPMFIRWPNHVPPGVIDSRLAANIDFAPTIYEATGVTPDPAYPLDGRSLLQPDTRERLLIEHQAGSGIPTFRGLRTAAYKYIENYPSKTSTVPDFREYYDLVNDPWELVNLFADGDPTNDPDYVPLSAQLNADYACSGGTCP